MIQLEVHKGSAKAELHRYYMSALPESYGGEAYVQFDSLAEVQRKKSARAFQKTLHGLRAIEASQSIQSRWMKLLARQWSSFLSFLHLSVFSSAAPCECAES